MKKLQDTDYMYASARMRALETHLVGRDRMEVLIEARSADEIIEKLAEYGFTMPASEGVDPAGASEGGVPEGNSSRGKRSREHEGERREAMLLSMLRDAYGEAEAAVPDPAVFRFLRYPYDDNNLKVALKCLITGTDPKGLYFDFGTVPAGEVTEAVREGRLSAFPPAMAEGVIRAREAFDKTGDPQQLDAILDRACYEDMHSDACATKEPALIGWVEAKIDLVNILICLRLIRMGQGNVGKSLMNQALLTGGRLSESFFDDAYAAGESGLWSAVAATDYFNLVPADGENTPLYAVEKSADDWFMNKVREDARVPFGAPVVAGYLFGVETAVKNIRIALASKDAGLSSDILRERVRMSYV